MTYRSVEAILEQQDADLGAAEAHGIATGMLCVEIRADAENWLRELIDDEQQLIDEDKALLHGVFEKTRVLLENQNEDFAFDLLMPDDDDPLDEQVEALRCWCQGFLFGVGYAQTGADWPGDTAEVMRDMIELTKIDTDVGDEEDENALVELREYVRAAVFTVRDQFAELGQSQPH
ncbi:UPF0149 family protein [Methylomonas rosea]|uniref:UPF0149 family protein n=1 Tax=Methylomonas rosea TaxID=2952227 RepID=A0ABT1TSK8_9GAMM|nr:UPF0149 family protein [Methylomonas sp. WSC-7]MCQ8117729.1 UPF0149 family protein [Methylomonas sp. WSC-7]